MEPTPVTRDTVLDAAMRLPKEWRNNPDLTGLFQYMTRLEAALDRCGGWRYVLDPEDV